MSGSTSSINLLAIICEEINRLGLNLGEEGFPLAERGKLRAFFTKNPNNLDLASTVLDTISVDNYNERLTYLKELLTESVAASSQVIEDQVLNEFIQALKNVEFDAEKNILKLADNTFFGLDDQPSELFIRNCYNDLLKTVEKPLIRKLRISGNPGVGKTFFGYYLLYILLRKDVTIVYDLHTMKNGTILFKEGKGFYLSEYLHQETIRNYLYKKDTWYIVDGKKPDGAAVAKTILITSPMKSLYYDFDKSALINIRIMPVWSWQEISYCNEELFKDINKDIVSQLYTKWGGIPRYVLQGALNNDIQRKLTQALETCDETIFQYIGGSNSRQDVSHVIVHMWTNTPENDDFKDEENTEDEGKVEFIAEEYYTETIIKFASDYVGETIYTRLKDSIIRRLQAEVEACITSGKSINNAYYGCYFEQIVHRIFRKGGRFRVRSLEPRDDGDDASISSFETFDKQDEVLRFREVTSIENNKYYQPDSKNFPSIDAIVAPNKLFQITIATNHPIKMVGLNLLHEKLAKDHEIFLYFVVPEQLYAHYQMQNFVTTKDSAARRIPRWIKKQVRQYVLGIDLSSEGSVNLPRTSSTATIDEGISNLSTVGAVNLPKTSSTATIDEGTSNLSTVGAVNLPRTYALDNYDPVIISSKRPSSGNLSKESKKSKRKK